MLKKFAPLILCLSLAVTAAGCDPANQTGPVTAPAQNATEQNVTEIINEFQAITGKDNSVAEAAAFIHSYITAVSRADAAKMVVEFENMQREFLPQLESMFAADNIQNKMHQERAAVKEQTGNIQDSELKELIAKTKNNGYKVETAEGTYFPVIDYEFYKQFRPHVTADIQDYIDLMAVESNQVPAKDAALVISWDDIIQRALNQEKFIDTHSDSEKLNDVRQLYQKYVTFILYGCNNTPLFRYDTKTIAPEARDAYLNAVANDGNSALIKTLEEYMQVIINNDYQLTDQVTQHRTSVMNKYAMAPGGAVTE